MTIEVVLQDFDGSKTIYPTEPPLRLMIHTAETQDLEVLVGKIYVQTDQRDEQGRVIYLEQR